MLSPRMYARVAPATYRIAGALRLHRLRSRRAPAVRRVGIDAGLALRFVLVADIHADSRFVPREDVRRLVDLVNSVDGVDAVLMPGDFVGHEGAAIDWCAAELSRLQRPAYATLGNHDHDSDVDTGHVVEALHAAGITVLVDQAVELRAAGYGGGIGAVWVAGIDSIRARPDVEAAFAGIPAGARCVVLGHEPALALRHEQLLHVAGHTHRGQVRLPGLPPPYVPSHSRPFVYGLHELETTAGGRRWVYTTAGVGSTTLPLRIGARPEIVVLDT